MSKNTQLEWLRIAEEEEKPFVTMVVGAQTVLQSLNATVVRFNSHYLRPRPGDTNHAMKVIAAKIMVIASLRELRLSIDKWNSNLRRAGALSEATIAHRKTLRGVLDKIHEFKDVRNCAFHFDDFNTEPTKLLEMYEYVARFDIEELNTMLKSIVGLVLMMRDDAMKAVGTG